MLSVQYEKGIMELCAFASLYASRNNVERIYCPCMDCWNNKKVKQKKLHKHLLLKGIDPQYKVWYMHSEVEPQNVEPQPVESSPEDNDDWEEDNLIDMVNNVTDEFVARPQVLESLRNDSELPLYEGCSKYTRLSATLNLFNMKAKNGWSDISFTELLTLVKDMLPEENTLPNHFYEAKKVMCPMGIECKKIHVCPNNCTLYENTYKDMDDCPRLFANSKDSDNMCWHAEKLVVDMKMRHPADSLQWAKVDNIFPTFGAESRNLHPGLCTDGVMTRII
ncbi:unnamed protein product [Rhodiola kirilowii]